MLTLTDLRKRYGATVAVDGLSLVVNPGEIIGLLGPNGAGKSTTVGMSVGLLSPDSGKVEFTGGGNPADPAVRRRIGLAPQALSLYETLSGEENLAFFGRLYGLSGAALDARVNAALAFVGLIERRKDRVSAYSGGMQRRLNLAAALLHEPDLILLDEPTAGVDPQSRNQLFDNIEALQAKGKTLIYTTHYMEEAERLCDRVAIIDKGKLLALGTVDELIAAHGGPSVLVAKQNGAETRIECPDPLAELNRLAAAGPVSEFRVERATLEQVFLRLTGRTEGLMFTPLIAIALKDLKLLLRNRGACFFTFAWPLLVAILFGFVFGGGGEKGKLQIAVVDEDHSAGAMEFAAGLAAADEFTTQPLERAAAIDQVRRGKLSAAVILPPGFGEAGGRMFYGKPPAVELWIDPAHSADKAMLEGLLQRQAARRLSSIVTDPKAGDDFIATTRRDIATADDKTKADFEPFLSDLDHILHRKDSAASAPASVPGSAPGAKKAEWSPLTVEAHEATAAQQGPHSAFEFSFPQGILWGLIGATMSFAVGLATERTHGTLLRLRAAPLSGPNLLAGKGLGGFLGLLIVQALVLGVGALLFGVRPGNLPLLALAVFSIAVCFTGLMLFISTLGKNEQAVSGAGWALLMPMAMIGGGMIPLFAMPAWLVGISHLSPMKWTVLAIEGVLWRGFSLQEMLVPCAVLLSVGLVAGLLGAKVVRAE